MSVTAKACDLLKCEQVGSRMEQGAACDRLPVRRLSTVAAAALGGNPHSTSLSLCFFQAEDGIRDLTVTGVQTCALPILDHVLPAQVRSRLKNCQRPTRRAGGGDPCHLVVARDREPGIEIDLSQATHRCGEDRKSVV